MYTGLEGFLQPFMSISLIWWIGIGDLWSGCTSA